jgi:hypothetical protein
VSFRFVTKSIHGYLIDYPVAIVLIVAPFLLRLGQSSPAALWLSVLAGICCWRLSRTTRLALSGSFPTGSSCGPIARSASSSWTLPPRFASRGSTLGTTGCSRSPSYS